MSEYQNQESGLPEKAFPIDTNDQKSWEPGRFSRPSHFLSLLSQDTRNRYSAFYLAWGTKLDRCRRVSDEKRRATEERYGFLGCELDSMVRRQLVWSCLLKAVKKNAYFASHSEHARAVFTDWIRNSVIVRTRTGGIVLHRRCVRAFELWFSESEAERLEYRRNRWFHTLGQLEHLPAPPKPRLVSPAVVRRVIEMSNANPVLSCRKVARRIQAKGMKVSPATVQRIWDDPDIYRDRHPRIKAQRDAEKKVWREAARDAATLCSRLWQSPT